MIKYVAFDPGETTGWAIFDENAQLIEMGQVKGREALHELFATGVFGQPEICIVEDFTLFQGKAIRQSGSKMETTRVIGSLDLWCDQNKIQKVKQPANIKPIAEKWSGMKPPSNHSQSHRIDAYNHGVYYLVKNNLRKPDMGGRFNQ